MDRLQPWRGRVPRLWRFLQKASGRRRAPKKVQSLRVLRQRVTPVSTVIDVGVLHGTTELRHIFGDARHYLFEPMVECAPVIKMAYAGCDHVLIHKAVSDEDGEVTLKVSGEPGSVRAGAVVAPGETKGAERTVQRISLDTYFSGGAGLEGGCLLKVDTDGHELNVLKGAVRLLPRCSIVIVEATASALPEISGFMQAQGFVIYDMVEPCYYDESLWQVDLIFISSALHAELFETIADQGYHSEKYHIYS